MTILTRLVFIAFFSLAALASDHKEAPSISETPPSDIADLYAFLNPDDNTKLVLAMTVNPFSVPTEGIAFNFSNRILYRFNIDNDGDAEADAFINFRFQPNGTFSAEFPGGITIDGVSTAATEEPEPNEAIVTSEEGIRIFAGPRDDPFFFDIVGFFRFLAGTGSFTGSDGFAGYNVSAIVVEIPVDMLGGSVLNIWATTVQPFRFKANSSGLFAGKQLDRAGNPAVATALIPSDLKDAYNRTKPEDDAENFAATIVASLTSLGTSAENIGVLASVAVPDMLTIDTTAASGFPNGRGLPDNVIDIILGLVLNSPGISDGVDTNDQPFLDEFPWLAPPWQPE